MVVQLQRTLQIFYYFVIATPSPVGTTFDYYILRPIFDFFQPKYNASTFALRDRLGGGNFGVVYEAVQRPRALQITQTGGCDLSELRCMHVCALHGITGTNDHLHRHGSSLSLAVHAVCVALQSVLVHILSAPACINGCGQVTAVTVSH